MRQRDWWLLIFLAFQLIVPLTYYLRDNPYDERFAWRMFSAVRLYQCGVELQEGSAGSLRPVGLPRVVHQAWVNHLRRNRVEVALALLERRCAEEGVDEARITTRCQSASGEPLPDTRYYRRCASGATTIERGDP